MSESKNPADYAESLNSEDSNATDPDLPPLAKPTIPDKEAPNDIVSAIEPATADKEGRKDLIIAIPKATDKPTRPGKASDKRKHQAGNNNDRPFIII